MESKGREGDTSYERSSLHERAVEECAHDFYLFI